ncbi:hypothetical protein Tco_1098372 [Tanacetum coccineum]
MSRAHPQAAIVSEEKLVQSANKLIIKKNNQPIASDSKIKDSLLRLVVGILKHHKLYKLVSLTATVPLHSEGQDSPLTMLMNTVDGKFKFRMEIPDTMINDAIKQLNGARICKVLVVKDPAIQSLLDLIEDHANADSEMLWRKRNQLKKKVSAAHLSNTMAEDI